MASLVGIRPHLLCDLHPDASRSGNEGCRAQDCATSSARLICTPRLRSPHSPHLNCSIEPAPAISSRGSDAPHRQWVRRQFSPRDVVDDVLTHASRLDDLGVIGLAPHLVPEAGKIARRVDDHGATIALDGPQREIIGLQSVTCSPDGVVGGQGTQIAAGLGEDRPDQFSEPRAEFRAGTACVGEDHSAVFGVLANPYFG